MIKPWIKDWWLFVWWYMCLQCWNFLLKYFLASKNCHWNELKIVWNRWKYNSIIIQSFLQKKTKTKGQTFQLFSLKQHRTKTKNDILIMFPNFVHISHLQSIISGSIQPFFLSIQKKKYSDNQKINDTILWSLGCANQNSITYTHIYYRQYLLFVCGCFRELKYPKQNKKKSK